MTEDDERLDERLREIAERHKGVLEMLAGLPVLKPCPFCGGEVEIVQPFYGPIGAHIFCLNCCLSIYGGMCVSEEDIEETIKKWNRRVNE